jgi:hypothetical protein
MFSIPFSSVDDSAPALPPKRDKRPINGSLKTLPTRSRVLPHSPSSSLKEEQENDEQIQSIVDDINDIIANYTRELDDALRSKETGHSISTCRHHSLDTLSKSSTRFDQSDYSVYSSENKWTHSANVIIGDDVAPSTTLPPLPPKRERGN